jgi:hypothetical protein
MERGGTQEPQALSVRTRLQGANPGLEGMRADLGSEAAQNAIPELLGGLAQFFLF